MHWKSWQKIIVARAPPSIPQIRKSDEIKKGPDREDSSNL